MNHDTQDYFSPVSGTPEGTLLIRQAADIIDSEPWYVAAMSNLSALLMASMDRLNWAGFYLVRDDQLVVGPFQGKPACVHIPTGKGVCGASIAQDRILNVPDVHQFPGHIACDSASNSELVIPLHSRGKTVAVLDIDSPVFRRFTEADAEGLKGIAAVIEEMVIWDEAAV